MTKKKDDLQPEAQPSEQPAPKAKPIRCYVYQGAGAYFQGMPTHDIEAEKWGQYPHALTERALELGLYRPEE